MQKWGRWGNLGFGLFGGGLEDVGEDGLFDVAALSGFDGDADDEVDFVGAGELEGDAGIDGGGVEALLVADALHVFADVFEIGTAMVLGGLEERFLGGLPVVASFEGDGENVEDVVVGVAFVDDGFGDEEAVGEDGDAAGALVGEFAGADFHDGGGEEVLVDDVAAEIFDLDAVADFEGAGAGFEDGAGDAEDEFLGGDDEGDGDGDDGKGEAAERGAPDENESDDEEEGEGVAGLDEPLAAEVVGGDAAADEAGGDSAQKNHHGDEDRCADDEAEEIFAEGEILELTEGFCHFGNRYLISRRGRTRGRDKKRGGGRTWGKLSILGGRGKGVLGGRSRGSVLRSGYGDKINFILIRLTGFRRVVSLGGKTPIPQFSPRMLYL